MLHRHMGWATVQTLRCPAGHRIPQGAIAFQHGAVQCTHKEPRRGAPAGTNAGHRGMCGRWVYVRACSGDLLLVIEATWEELQEMRRANAAPADALRYFGVASVG